MLAAVKNKEEDNMVNNEIGDSHNELQETGINGEQDYKSTKLDIASSLNNEKDFDLNEQDDLNKVNGGSDSEDWSSSSDEARSEPSENGSLHDADSDVNMKNSTLSPHLSNEISSHCDEDADEPNVNLNGDTSIPDTNTSVDKSCTKKVRPLKICFGVKNSINGLKVKNSKISKQDDNSPKVHYIERHESESDEPEPETQGYAQYLLQPSVKFKCSRCGTKNFSTMMLLKEHMAGCNGQTPLTVTSVSSVNSVFNEDVNTATNLRITRKVFLCSSCGTYYQSYDLYIHMRDVHNKQICLFCFNMFCRSQQLWDHLIAAHDLKLGEYTNVSQIRNAFKGSFYITCCTCNRIFSEEECFDQHTCQVQNDVQSINDVPIIRTEDDTAHVTDYFAQDDKKLPSDSESEDSPPASPLSPVHSPPSPEEMEKEACNEKEQDISEIVGVNAAVGQQEAPQSDTIPDEHRVPEENHYSSPEHSLDLDVKVNETLSEPVHVAENVADEYKADEDRRLDNDVPQEESAIQTDTGPPADSAAEVEPMDTNEAQNDDENRSVKGDSSDSETLNALFDQSNPEETKIAQPLPMALMLDDTVASLSPQTLIRECVRTSCTSCTYCNNAILIAVNGKQLVKHLLTEHRYKPTKNEDDSEQVTQKIESIVPELEDVYMNASSNEFDGTFVCFQCSFSSTLLKELCAHKRKAHQMNIFLCIVCKCNFYHYSELLCHECPGEYTCEPFSLRFRCCFCSLNHLPSAFRLMVHLRKFHKACDYCLLRYNDQYELFSHMTKQHKMHHLCYKCNLAYRSRNDINKHLFWKHGTESVLCKRCLQKKWPHAYHFCMPATTYSCEECNRVFSKAVALTVHRRAHAGEFPFACECDQRFISKRLLAAHQKVMHPTDDGKDETLDTSRESATKAEDNGISNEERPNDDDDKKRRKKKRKKTKVNEKPLLDELPPLNLSSESDDESPEDEAAAKSEPPQIPPPSPPETPIADVAPVPEASVEEKPPSPPPPEPVVEVDEKTPEVPDDFIERALNCLLIEHSYCIPDSIFHSESITDGESKHKTPDARNTSMSPHKHDGRSCCKSTTPHKRKRSKKNSSGADSSSSGSSSDSDSSSSSCGSNCSCNRSNSNCSSSSSASDYSTTPEKKKSKKQKKKDDENDDKRTQQQREQLFLLDARESDLDTDISSAGEEFYEKRPCFVPPPPAQNDKKIDIPAEPEPSTVASVEQQPKSSRSSRKDKKKKKKRIKLNLAGRIPPNCNPLKNMNASTPPRTYIPVPVPNNEFTNQQLHPPHMQYVDDKSFNDANATESYTNSDAQADDSNSRLSKRKRVKNKFYGYSSSDEASRDSASVRSMPKKRVLTKKSNAPKNRHFVGIRAKQLPPLPKQLSISIPFTPVSAAHPPDTYNRPPQQSTLPHYNPYRGRFSSSEDSDSDEKRHTLVINLPKEKPNNAYRPPMYSDESMSSNSWYSSPRTELPSRAATVGPQLASQSSGAYTNSPLKNSEKLYCYCQCPYDEVSEMIGCDAPNCKIEWFHFECVGIMVPPKGKWYCPSCRRNRENVSRFV